MSKSDICHGKKRRFSWCFDQASQKEQMSFKASMHQLGSECYPKQKRHLSWRLARLRAKATFSNGKHDISHGKTLRKATFLMAQKRRFSWMRNGESDICHGSKATLG